jgi:hypothetical protein
MKEGKRVSSPEFIRVQDHLFSGSITLWGTTGGENFVHVQVFKTVPKEPGVLHQIQNTCSGSLREIRSL